MGGQVWAKLALTELENKIQGGGGGGANASLCSPLK